MVAGEIMLLGCCPRYTCWLELYSFVQPLLFRFEDWCDYHQMGRQLVQHVWSIIVQVACYLECKCFVCKCVGTINEAGALQASLMVHRDTALERAPSHELFKRYNASTRRHRNVPECGCRCILCRLQ